MGPRFSGKVREKRQRRESAEGKIWDDSIMADAGRVISFRRITNRMNCGQ